MVPLSTVTSPVPGRTRHTPVVGHERKVYCPTNVQVNESYGRSRRVKDLFQLGDRMSFDVGFLWIVYMII